MLKEEEEAEEQEEEGKMVVPCDHTVVAFDWK